MNAEDKNTLKATQQYYSFKGKNTFSVTYLLHNSMEATCLEQKIRIHFGRTEAGCFGCFQDLHSENDSLTDRRRQGPATIKPLKTTEIIMVLSGAPNDFPLSLGATAAASL